MLSMIVEQYAAKRVELCVNQLQIAAIEGFGGGLSDAVSLLGLMPLVDILIEGQELKVIDEGLSLSLTHTGEGYKVFSKWKNGQTMETFLSLDEDLSDFMLEPNTPKEVELRRHPPEVIDIPETVSPQRIPSKELTSSPAIVAASAKQFSWRNLQSDSRPLTAKAAIDAILNCEQALWVKNGEIHNTSLSRFDGLVPAVSPRDLGSSFCDAHQLAAPYVAGAMAGGIASVTFCKAMANQGLLSFFGAGGLELERISRALTLLTDHSGPLGFNLLHSPNDQALEAEIVDLYLDAGINRVSASAFMQMTPALVKYRLHGIHSDHKGHIFTPNMIFAKVSHPAIADKFLSPPPLDAVKRLVQDGDLTQEQANMSSSIPMAEDITVEGDSGGHTDRRPLSVCFSTIRRLRDAAQRKHGYTSSIRLGAAGGLGDPHALSAAFALGADYVVMGSIHQCSLQAKTSDSVKELLASASPTDFAMAASPDMFEMGARVQVLSRGTMFAPRANRLRELYLQYNSIDALSPKDRNRLEKMIFARSIDDVWADTAEYWALRDPSQLERAEKNPRHRMALLFRWYLGQSSRWARKGNTERRRDFQIWSGPAMGAFNDWVAGSWLEPTSERSIQNISYAMIRGAQSLRRIQMASLAGYQGSVPIRPQRPPTP